MCKNSERPNILWIITDQHKATALSAVGDIPNLTPNLDSLAEDGYLFENAYTPSPVCGPARACLKTGKFPAATGAVGNWVPFKEKHAFLPQQLKADGYTTGMVGKLHFYPPLDDYGFEKCWLNDAPYSIYADDDKHSKYVEWLRKEHYDHKGIDPVVLFDADEKAYKMNAEQFINGSAFRTLEEHDAHWTTQKAIELLEEREEGKPFFYYVSYFGPHQPYEAPKPYDEWIQSRDIHLPESYYIDFMKHNPIFNATARATHDHLRKELHEEQVKRLIAHYLGQVKMIDDYIGEIIQYLKDNDLYDNTLIVFTSDHGDHLGEHGLFFKGQMYDSCVKVPLILKAPHVKAGEVKKEIVNTIDLYATLMDYAKVAMPGDKDIQSRSLRPLVEGANYIWDNITYSIVGDNRDQATSMIRWYDMKLIRLQQENGNVLYELYNVAQDPEENHNLLGDHQYIKDLACLKQKLDEWFSIQYANYPQYTRPVQYA